MNRPRVMLATLVLLLVLAFGLGSATPPATPQIHVVRIESMKFTPNVIRVHPGDTVEFRNTDLVPHTVTERSTRAFDSGMLNAKETWKFVAGEEGTLGYRCVYHPDMTGTIIVENTARSAGRSLPATKALCGQP